MPNSAFTENTAEAARAFVEHLRRHPTEARQDPGALAARFGLETEFVRRALARLPASGRPAAPPRPNRFAARAGGLLTLIDGSLERAAASPLRFEALSLLMLVGFVVALWWTMPSRLFGVVGFRLGLSGLLALATVAMQMAVFFRRRMVRYAFYGGLLFGVGTAVPTMVGVWVGLQTGSVETRSTEVGQGLIVFSIGLAMLFVGLLYAGVAALASLFGGWVQMRRADEEWERLSRQELLQRYFELQRRLEHSPAASEAPQTWEAWPLVRAARRRPVLAAGVLGLGAGLVHVVLGLAFGARTGMAPSGEALGLLSSVHSLDSYVLLGLVAFLAGSTARGATAGLAFAGGAFLASLVPLGGFGLAVALDPARALAAGFAAILGALAGLGATVQRRAAREGRLQRNDGATLVAEMLEIQWRLEEDATSVTVMVVDAAKSTAMKVGADPLDVEYSFREYQMWIAEVCAGFGAASTPSRATGR